MSKKAKIGVGLVVVVVLLYLLLRPSAKTDDKPQWNRTETPGGAPAIGVFGSEWG